MSEKNSKKIKNDIVFIVALIFVLAIIGACILAFGKTGFFTGKKGNTVKVVVNGELYGTYSLENDQIIQIKSENGYNYLVIENGKAYVREASCPDGVCSSHRPISFVGASIVCLPNKVVVSIEQNESQGGNDSGGLDIVS